MVKRSPDPDEKADEVQYGWLEWVAYGCFERGYPISQCQPCHGGILLELATEREQRYRETAGDYLGIEDRIDAARGSRSPACSGWPCLVDHSKRLPS
jgi:hypothetical protein